MGLVCVFESTQVVYRITSEVCLRLKETYSHRNQDYIRHVVRLITLGIQTYLL